MNAVEIEQAVSELAGRRSTWPSFRSPSGGRDKETTINPPYKGAQSKRETNARDGSRFC
jgi:hypothetical protein